MDPASLQPGTHNSPSGTSELTTWTSAWTSGTCRRAGSPAQGKALLCHPGRPGQPTTVTDRLPDHVEGPRPACDPQSEDVTHRHRHLAPTHLVSTLCTPRVILPGGTHKSKGAEPLGAEDPPAWMLKDSSLKSNNFSFLSIMFSESIPRVTRDPLCVHKERSAVFVLYF